MSTARASYLFVPANRPERFAKAAATGAMPILDLEDAVAPQDKPTARAALAAAADVVAASIVRINAAGTADFEADMDALSALSPVAVMLPKAEAADDVATLRAALPSGTAVIPLIESARGLANVRTIAAAPGVERLAFGTVDLGLDLAVEEGSDVMAAFRADLVLASRLAGIAAPIDGVCTLIDDEVAMQRHASRAVSCGFGGVLCIHPRQVAVVDRAFAPSEATVARARRIVAAVEASGEGATKLDGQMIDRPVIEMARRTLALHARLNDEVAA